MSVGARALRAIITLYQRWSAGRLPRCRFTPTCSAYAAEAIEVHGALRGSWLALRRLIRCRPGGGFGYDPCPPPSARPLRPEPTPAPTPQEMSGV